MIRSSIRIIVCCLRTELDVFTKSTMIVRWCCIVLLFTVATASDGTRTAIAHLRAGDVVGNIIFTETAEGVRVSGHIVGMAPGLYGFHVHKLGDTTTCDNAGPHFNPTENVHAGREHEIRHVGDLGNVQFQANHQAQLNFVDSVITLRGPNNILGRTLVLHAQKDDLGQGGHPLSETTGNAGPRVACGVIGIYDNDEAWNAAVSISPSMLLFIFSAAGIFFLL